MSYWIPVDDPVFSGDQVRHDSLKSICNTSHYLDLEKTSSLKFETLPALR
jgi:hypothetical protein